MKRKTISQGVFSWLVSCDIEGIDDLKNIKRNLEEQIQTEELERNELMKEVERMSYKISELNESLTKKAAARHDYDRTIQEAEGAYEKIMESSQLLLSMVKREAASLDETLHTKRDVISKRE